MANAEKWFWLSHRVSYQETDSMGVVYYANYLHWFEIGRTEYIRSRGIAYRDLEDKGLFLPVREATCRYYKPARYDDIVAIGSRIESFGRASITFTYEIRSENKEQLLATGSSQLAAVGKNGRPVALPKEIIGLASEEHKKRAG